MDREIVIQGIKFVIDDVEEVNKRLKGYLDIENILDITIEFISSETNTVFFLNEDYTTTQDLTEKTRYALLDTGITNNNNPIFFSLIRRESEFCGHFVGCIKYLSEKAKQYSSRKSRFDDNVRRFRNKYDKWIDKRNQKHIDMNVSESLETPDIIVAIPVSDMGRMVQEAIEKTPIQVECVDQSKDINTDCKSNEEKDGQTDGLRAGKYCELTESIAKHLLYPKWRSIEGLNRYIKIVGVRLGQLIEMKKTEYYVENALKYAIANTGLIDNLGKDILIMYRYNMKEGIYNAYKWVTRKTEYLEENFQIGDTQKVLKPISFFNEGEQTFSPEWEEIDFNQECLFHIINERRDRFPEDYKELDNHIIASRLTEALKMSIRILQKDHNYAKASYSGKEKCVSWFLPIHMSCDIMQEPELVIAIRRVGAFYEPKTVLPYNDEMKDKFMALSLYREVW